MPNCLDNMPWRSLKGLGKYAADFLQLGDYRNVELKNGAQVQFRIIGFNHDKTSDGSLVPISWEMVDCLPNTYPWNRRDTNEGSWEATQIRHRLNDADGDIHRLIPDEILDVVTPVIKQTADVYTGENRIIETLDSFWIKSEKELYGRNIYSAPGEGHWYEWYRQEDVAWFKLRNGNPEYTMLRSPISGYSNGFCHVNSNGDARITTPTAVMASLSASALKAAWRSHQLLPEPVKSNSFLQAPGAPRRRPGAFYTHNGSNLLVVWADNRKVNK